MTLKHTFNCLVTEDAGSGVGSGPVGPNEWNSDHTVGGTSLQIQYNNAGSLTGMAGTSWDNTNIALTIAGATVTNSNPILNLSQTWNNAAAGFNVITSNVTDSASLTTTPFSSTHILVQKDTITRFAVGRLGDLFIGNQYDAFNSATANLITYSNGIYQLVSGVSGNQVAYAVSNSGDSFARIRMGIEASTSGPFMAWGPGNAARDTFLSRPTTATWQFGDYDSATPVAQTIQVQSVVAGTSNTAGQNWTINASKGTGTGAGGDIIFQTSPAGSSGSTQNPSSTSFTIKNTGIVITKGFTVSTLPVGVTGARSHVTDSNATLTAGIGAIVAAGGANIVPVFFDGTNWRIG